LRFLILGRRTCQIQNGRHLAEIQTINQASACEIVLYTEFGGFIRADHTLERSP